MGGQVVETEEWTVTKKKTRKVVGLTAACEHNTPLLQELKAGGFQAILSSEKTPNKTNFAKMKENKRKAEMKMEQKAAGMKPPKMEVRWVDA